MHALPLVTLVLTESGGKCSQYLVHFCHYPGIKCFGFQNNFKLFEVDWCGIFLPPAFRRMREGNVFTPVCLSIHTHPYRKGDAAGGMPLAITQEDFLVLFLSVMKIPFLYQFFFSFFLLTFQLFLNPLWVLFLLKQCKLDHKISILKMSNYLIFFLQTSSNTESIESEGEEASSGIVFFHFSPDSFGIVKNGHQIKCKFSTESHCNPKSNPIKSSKSI